MAEYGNTQGSSGKNTNPVFNRSLTVRATPQSGRPYLYSSAFNRTASGKISNSRFYNSLESMVSAGNSIKGKVKKLCSIFETPKNQNSASASAHLQTPKNQNSASGRNQNSASGSAHLQTPSRLKSCASAKDHATDNKVPVRLPGTEDRIVLYFTSLRGIRRTFEDCYAVRMIFKGFRVWVDERDISMDAAYRKELQSVLGEKKLTLPQVFIRGEHVGGAETIKQMFETGELAKVLHRFPKQKPGFFCEACGDVRFVPCGTCNGSRKIFDEDEGKLKRCSDCNENGLIRCPDCCS